jgi:UDP-glucose 4-epimerase
MNVLVTGGAGYIGSHTCVAAYAAGHTITILDNLSNSSPESLNRVEKISGKRPRLVVGDIGDRSVVRSVLDSEKFDAVILAVAHKEFMNLDVKGFLKDNGVVYDVKGVLDRDIVDARL